MHGCIHSFIHYRTWTRTAPETRTLPRVVRRALQQVAGGRALPAGGAPVHTRSLVRASLSPALRGLHSPRLVAPSALRHATPQMFTPMHDAAHGSVFNNAGGMRWANGLVGRIACLPFGPYVAFRYIHLQHHKHTNHDGLDPDMYSGRGTSWLLPLRWLTQDLHYYVEYLPRLPKRPARESLEVLVHMGALASIAWWPAIGPMQRGGCAADILWFWAVPGRIAFAFLAFSFDYLPHRPHQELDRYKGTSILALKADGTGMATLTPLLLYQNYHAIHHLWPYIPFYRYSNIWHNHRPEFADRGTIIRGLFPIFVPMA